MKKKNRHRFRIKPTQPEEKIDATTTLKRIAEQYMQIECTLVPLILEKSIPPHEALVLIACYTNGMITGKKSMSEQDIIGATNLLVHLWKQGLFVPSANYPYTLAQTLEGGGTK